MSSFRLEDTLTTASVLQVILSATLRTMVGYVHNLKAVAVTSCHLASCHTNNMCMAATGNKKHLLCFAVHFERQVIVSVVIKNTFWMTRNATYEIVSVSKTKKWNPLDYSRRSKQEPETRLNNGMQVPTPTIITSERYNKLHLKLRPEYRLAVSFLLSSFFL